MIIKAKLLFDFVYNNNKQKKNTMYKLTFKITPSKKNTVSGIAPITVRLTCNRKTTYLSLGKLYSIPIADWDYKKDLPKRLSKHEQLYHNVLKLNMVIENELLQLSSKLNEISLIQIRDIIKIRLENIDEQVENIIEDVEPETIDFLTYFKNFVDRKKEMGFYGTHDNYSKVYTKLYRYMEGKKVPFTYINVKFLEEYELHLKNEEHNNTNSRNNNFKTIRAVLNKAIADGLMAVDKYPFRIFKLKSEIPKREFLSMEELNLLENFELQKGSKKYHHRNMFLFGVFTGLRISDILLLKWQNINDGKINIIMRKTEKAICIKLIDKAIKILDLYYDEKQSKKSFVFPMLNNEIDTNDRNLVGEKIKCQIAYVNKNMYEISQSLKLNKRLNFHSSRHTFATLLLTYDIPVQVVKELLGHSKIQTTMIYTHITNKVMDKEMDKFNLAMN